MRTVIATMLLMLLMPATASAHLLVTSPSPRVADDNIKEGRAPCGGPRGSVVHSLVAGEPLTIEFDETVAHPGHFELRFSEAGDVDWQMLDANIPDQGGVGSYTHTFDVPEVECDDCTLQFIQVMTDRNPPTNYYNCIDVEITMPPAPQEDVGVPADVGPEPDVGSSGNNASPNNSTPGMTTQEPATNNVPDPVVPQTNQQADPTNIHAGGEVCSTAPATSDFALWLLLGAVTLARRRSSRGSSAAR